MPFDHRQLRDKWYSAGWYSDRTCLDAFEAGAVEHKDVPLTFIIGDSVSSPTVCEIHDRAVALAASLQRLGVRDGDAVAVQLTNRVECAVAYQAVLLCGAVLVPIVHIYGMAEVAFVLDQSAAKVLIMPERHGSIVYSKRLQDLSRIDSLQHVVMLDAESGEGYLAWSQLDTSAARYRRPAVAADDICLLLYTSGTASAPKGVQHTHNTVLAEQRTMPALLAGKPDDVSLVTFPPGHIAGVGSMLRPLLSGARTVFMDGWDPAQAVEVVHRFGVTCTAGTPFHLAGILDLGDTGDKLASLREFLVGAAPVAEEIGRRAAQAGISTFRSYGATEHPTITGEHEGQPQWARLSTDGKPLPGSEIRIVGSDGADCPIGIDGEVVVRGPDQFVGYQDYALNAEAFTDDGWFRTGDLGHLDAHGRLTITDRIKDVIIRGGETISSGQVEEVLNAHPAVADGVAVAAPDSRYGDVVAAVVVLKPGYALNLDDLRAHFAASGLARQKTPERLAIVDELPRTSLGKVRKAQLRSDHFGAARR
ncbi:AMP-binding protein [Mycobacterium intracellulare]|uniref:Long-chain-fatty-acid--CoA ligase n=1 Tax=Mycobacterium intracellulare TaxID=1767 RepID=A0A7R7RLY9_MYCIT|nr:AMP-binding protein [Mycobacterium intracellulare]BCO98704.1 long-chain-fatty-acid--CoA ligase [Mycobacterium intracellulare]